MSPDAGKIRLQPGRRLKNNQSISTSDRNDAIDWFVDDGNARQSWPEGKSSGYLLSCFWF
ncbi:hypothetical protein DOV67_26410 [Salmonella enterica subsp. enterica serovar Java]|uniref:Uncharacterized protein n=3 Tax=Salmonella enterica TaxID=28901 RepID=A0A403K2V1_SALER|nr:hypothetical protein [Salmonella enterica subsp. enterica serovar Java]EAO9321702.1 hypothetical protein [Salmonella enterica]EBR8575001.1 hypothetical protein [Salmonella enterica subsp. enterica serovar Java]ECS8432311.1 hypothetical protein [Salmonella enterica]MLE32623.1 hypothetical protein [Salmonella enterica]